MVNKKLIKRLYELEIGKILHLKNTTGESEGSFLRVPSGWIYRYTVRSSLSTCFIPYTEIIKMTEDITFKSCPYCKSTDIFIMADEEISWVQCGFCYAASGLYSSKEIARKMWNDLKR